MHEHPDAVRRGEGGRAHSSASPPAPHSPPLQPRVHVRGSLACVPSRRKRLRAARGCSARLRLVCILQSVEIVYWMMGVMLGWGAFLSTVIWWVAANYVNPK
eukprot:4640733-Prymnesium_polylepis.1